MYTIKDHLLRYQNGIETSDKLKIELEEAVKKTVQDNTFRVQLGASDGYWKLYNAALLTLSQDTNEQCVIQLIKLTRNVVAGEIGNQNLAIQYGALYKIEELLVEKIASPSDTNMILQVCTQAICNMITNNATAIDFIWKIWMSNKERGSVWSLMLSKSDPNLIMSTLVLIINCIRGSKERCDLLVSKQMGRDIIAAILGDIERLHGDEQDKNFELSYAVISELITFGHFKELYQHVDDQSDKNVISDHQVILLKLLDSKIHAHNKREFPNFIKHAELKFLALQLSITGKAALQVIVQVKENGSEMQPDQISNVYTAIVLLLQILNELFVLDQDDCGQDTKALLVDVDALSLATDMLCHLETIKVPSPRASQEEDPQAGFKFLKRECVRMMGTMCYKDKSMQDRIRELGGIPLVLCQFRIDDSNPYLREYATVALRNMLDNNPENQKLIQELKPEQVVQTDELQQMGIVPELTPDGKLRMKKAHP